ncbi:MAG: hypothetical protein C4320_00025 [Armatimonadota bacterium]
MALSDVALSVPGGFRIGAARCGLKNRRNDVGVIVVEEGALAAGVFTTNQVRAACVDLTRSVLPQLRALVVNSGNANCCTGERGQRDAFSTQTLLARELGLEANQVAVASTGIIGVSLDMVKMESGIRASVADRRTRVCRGDSHHRPG